MSKPKATMSSKHALLKAKGYRKLLIVPKPCFIQSVLWQNLYISKFGETWPKAAVMGIGQLRLGPVAPVADPPERPVGHWKRLYLNAMVGQDEKKWRRDLCVVSPYTGLPCRTTSVLRNLGISWELTVSTPSGVQQVVVQAQVNFFRSALTVSWCHGSWKPYNQLSSLQIHGVAKVDLNCPCFQRPGCRSLMSQLGARALSARSPVIGRDKLVKVLLPQPGLAVGIWRGTSSIAFVIACFHFHRLVERSLLGSSTCYTLHIVLHSEVAEIMSGHFSQLFCRKAQIQDGHIELVAISRTNLSQHTPVSSDIALPWRCEALDGTVENCCLMSLTLLDEWQHPFWCVSTPLSMAPAERAAALYDYDGEHFTMRHLDPGGHVAMEFVRTEQPRQLYLVALTLHVPLQDVNRHFGTSYLSSPRPPGESPGGGPAGGLVQ
ncbi:hypothetical protein NHX12_021192 [Muraenolepis orangiensis]|uniref:Uncharacterized protein n=1 Tax=Muraenolepis orangiensis TaxID=630683 RepID=A0A9Q0ESL8_9TELE|nr:hypothetical protein NHX12_021192 [Muraenolepis orangiensis]